MKMTAARKRYGCTPLSEEDFRRMQIRQEYDAGASRALGLGMYLGAFVLIAVLLIGPGLLELLVGWMGL